MHLCPFRCSPRVDDQSWHDEPTYRDWYEIWGWSKARHDFLMKLREEKKREAQQQQQDDQDEQSPTGMPGHIRARCQLSALNGMPNADALSQVEDLPLDGPAPEEFHLAVLDALQEELASMPTSYHPHVSHDTFYEARTQLFRDRLDGGLGIMEGPEGGLAMHTMNGWREEGTRLVWRLKDLTWWHRLDFRAVAALLPSYMKKYPQAPPFGINDTMPMAVLELIEQQPLLLSGFGMGIRITKYQWGEISPKQQARLGPYGQVHSFNVKEPKYTLLEHKIRAKPHHALSIAEGVFKGPVWCHKATHPKSPPLSNHFLLISNFKNTEAKPLSVYRNPGDEHRPKKKHNYEDELLLCNCEPMAAVSAPAPPGKDPSPVYNLKRMLAYYQRAHFHMQERPQSENDEWRKKIERNFRVDRHLSHVPLDKLRQVLLMEDARWLPKPLRDFIINGRGDVENLDTWELALRRLLNLMEVCAFESAEAGVKRLLDAGLKRIPAHEMPHVFRMIKLFLTHVERSEKANALARDRALEPGSQDAARALLEAMRKYSSTTRQEGEDDGGMRPLPPMSLRNYQDHSRSSLSAGKTHESFQFVLNGPGEPSAGRGEGLSFLKRKSKKKEDKESKDSKRATEDYRRLKEPDLRRRLMRYGYEWERVKTLKRWDLVSLLRSRDDSKKGESRHHYLKRLQEIFHNQEFALSHPNPPDSEEEQEAPDHPMPPQRRAMDLEGGTGGGMPGGVGGGKGKDKAFPFGGPAPAAAAAAGEGMDALGAGPANDGDMDDRDDLLADLEGGTEAHMARESQQPRKRKFDESEVDNDALEKLRLEEFKKARGGGAFGGQHYRYVPRIKWTKRVKGDGNKLTEK
ncbi:unnamed protein product [Vitrella brassicaformis CCMP3155]|uniref:Transcription initiation factor TFIID subunit 1 histone acetyltransferase domain-containing protein n=1 Tax=Vitrella brassicaformis (strain CCMP3155) TaxID=1169540 RepID=A0A0G4GBZ7_VITBC|nr:unnamed protein product [Vitrella brassicaformis CCMP3155]|eukprot:CEM26630.1 unnamed protein product [Vitrella brassicaformis CCMP3155]